jgi:hypothetical protein
MGGRRKGEIKKEKKWSQKCEKRESGQPKTKRPKKKNDAHAKITVAASASSNNKRMKNKQVKRFQIAYINVISKKPRNQLQ